MWYYGLMIIALIFSLNALPKTIQRYKNEKQVSDLLEIIGTAALGVAVILYAFETLAG